MSAVRRRERNPAIMAGEMRVGREASAPPFHAIRASSSTRALFGSMACDANPNVPALDAVTDVSVKYAPASSSPIGERQMFPVHTKRMFTDFILTATASVFSECLVID